MFTFSTLQLHTPSIRDVVGGVTLQAVVGVCAGLTVLGTGLTGVHIGVVKGLRTAVQTQAFMQVTLHSKLIWGIKGGPYSLNVLVVNTFAKLKQCTKLSFLIYLYSQ